MKPTFVDADVLIAAAKGTEDFSAPALAVLDDPDRSFVCSDYLRLEVLPNAVFFQRTGIVAFYEEFFASAERWVRPSVQLSRRAFDLACRYGLGAVDALHVAAAIVRGVGFERAEEARQLAYRLHQICDRKKRAEEAFAYNALSQSWERVLELGRREEETVLF